MLADLIADNYGDKENYTCAERILAGADTAYGLGLPPEALRLAAGMGGGMYIGHTCGVVNAAVMALGYRFGESGGKASPELREMTTAFLEAFSDWMGSLLCDQLRSQYSTPEEKCKPVILAAAQILDTVMEGRS